MRCRAAALLSILVAAVFTAASQDFDSAYVARVKDSVERYYRRNPGKRMSAIDKRFNVLPLYGVMYTQETGLLAMGGFTGMYRTSSDTLVPMSNVGMTALISTNLTGAGLVTGRWYAPGGRFTVEYMAGFSHSPRRFWGLGYENASDDGNLSSFTGMRGKARIDFLYRKNGFLAGVFAGYNYYKAVDFTSPVLIGTSPVLTHYMTLGARFDYDSRDVPVSPSRGMYIKVEQSANVSVNEYSPFYLAEVTADFYFSVWKGGVLALDVYGNMSTGGSPWTMWPEAGGDVRLRGYYQGRYRDRNLLSVQLELRQHIHGIHGAAVWAGAGNVFPSFSGFDIRNTLPTYGAGYRLSFAGLVFRLDTGFGLWGQWAVTVGFNHSF